MPNNPIAALRVKCVVHHALTEGDDRPVTLNRADNNAPIVLTGLRGLLLTELRAGEVVYLDITRANP